MPKTAANHSETHFSAAHATAKPPMARTKMKILKPVVIQVSCMKSASQDPGSISMYDENSSATTTVTTKGTVDDYKL